MAVRKTRKPRKKIRRKQTQKKKRVSRKKTMHRGRGRGRSRGRRQTKKRKHTKSIKKRGGEIQAYTLNPDHFTVEQINEIAKSGTIINGITLNGKDALNAILKFEEDNIVYGEDENKKLFEIFINNLILDSGYYDEFDKDILSKRINDLDKSKLTELAKYVPDKRKNKINPKIPDKPKSKTNTSKGPSKNAIIDPIIKKINEKKIKTVGELKKYLETNKFGINTFQKIINHMNLTKLTEIDINAMFTINTYDHIYLKNDTSFADDALNYGLKLPPGPPKVTLPGLPQGPPSGSPPKVILPGAPPSGPPPVPPSLSPQESLPTLPFRPHRHY